VPLIVPLDGFDKAFDGPAMKTTDFETRMRSRQVQFQRHAEALQKKMDERSKGANSSTTVKKK